MSAANKPQAQPSAKKKPYAKPRIVHRQRIEARASACAYSGPGTGKSSTGAPYQCGQSFLFS
ncbi:MAG: hypothetical protein HZC40_00205 [Chloroflexi bacterium]|nr:hypothetical protein [Chloroflexota bacterium]